MQDPRCKHEYLENEPNLRKGQRMVMKVTQMYVEARDRRYSCLKCESYGFTKEFTRVKFTEYFFGESEFLVFPHSTQQHSVEKPKNIVT